MDNCEILRVEETKLICVCLLTGQVFEVTL